MPGLEAADSIFYAVACTLAGLVGEGSLAVGRLNPDLTPIRDISTHIAVAVCEIAFAKGLAGIERPDDLDSVIRARMFEPRDVPCEAA